MSQAVFHQYALIFESSDQEPDTIVPTYHVYFRKNGSDIAVKVQKNSKTSELYPDKPRPEDKIVAFNSGVELTFDEWCDSLFYCLVQTDIYE